MTSSRPLPSCPALHQRPASIGAAGFTFVVEDCEDDPDGRKSATEVFAYFHPVRDDGDGTLATDSMVVPVGSPIARMAHKVGADATGLLARQVEKALRARVGSCTCADGARCPALSEMSLLEALEDAAGQC